MVTAKIKKCSLCQTKKEHNCFNKKKNSKDGLQNVCRSCNKQRAKRYYKENHKKHLGIIYNRKLKRKEVNQKLFFDFLLKSKCVDCSESNPLVLELDHIRDKRKEVSILLLYGYSWKVIKQEIDKCEVRCANCHSKKTHESNKSFRWRLYNKLINQ